MCILFFFFILFLSFHRGGMICPRSQSWDLSSVLLISVWLLPQATWPGARSATWWRTQVQGRALTRCFTWLTGHKATETQNCRSDTVRVLTRLSSHNADLNHFLLPWQTRLTWLQIQRWFPDGPHTLTHGTPWRTGGTGHTGEGLPLEPSSSVAGGDPETRRGQSPGQGARLPSARELPIVTTWTTVIC